MGPDEVLTITHMQGADDAIELRVGSNDQPDFDLQLKSLYSSPSMQARYADFSIVSPFVQCLLHRRPGALQIDYLCTETAALARFALCLGVKVVVTAGRERAVLGESDAAQRWGAALLGLLEVSMASDQPRAGDNAGFAYEHYALGSRNHALLIKWVERVARWFEDRQKILDLGCGTGVFLDQMARKGLRAEGIDSNKASIRYAESLGLNVRCVDVREGLSAVDAEDDAIHCAHVVEHMTPTELAETMGYVYRALKPGGRAVFVFPDPESIRSQLLGFWRDPTHVRFYHPDTVESMARAAGLSLEFNSQKEDARRVEPFSFEPPEDEEGEVVAHPASGEAESKLLHRLSVLERQVAVQERWIRQLWAINQTWAWADDAVLTFLRPQAH